MRKKAGRAAGGVGAVMDERGIEEQLRYKVPQIRLALIRERDARKPVSIRAPKDAYRFLAPLRYASEEQFVALHLNAMNEVMGIRMVSHGTLSSSLVHPREVFKAAFLDNAHGLIVAHNHPGGSTKISAEDEKTTKQLVESGELLGVPIIDHLIVTSTGKCVSVREEMPELWDE